MAEYQVYALRYAGPITGSGALLMWRQDWDLSVERNYYIWCLLGPQGPVVVDSGITPALASESEVPHYHNPIEVLARLGVDASQVKHLILTHLHWDHAGGLELFPRARVYLHQDEYDFWTKDPLAKKAPFAALTTPRIMAFLGELEKQGRLELVEKDAEILPGISGVAAPGHSHGLMAAAVETAKGIAVLGSDAALTFRNLEEGWPSAIFCDLGQCLLSMERLQEVAASPELVFPGHDAAMANDYPQVAEGVTRLV